MDALAFLGSGSSKPPIRTPSNTLALLDCHGFRAWSDARVFRFIEYLVHPTIRQHHEQASLVQALNRVIVADGFELAANAQLSGHPLYTVLPISRGVAGRPKNLIFASIGPKPELGFADAVNNDVVILRNAEWSRPDWRCGRCWCSPVRAVR